MVGAFLCTFNEMFKSRLSLLIMQAAMVRINVTDAVRRFSDLLNRVFYEGETFELERGNREIA